MSATDHAKTKMSASIEHLKNELKNIRTGRANPSMLDSVQVEVYGSMMRIKELASVTAPEARMLLITPFDPHNSSAIGKAIEKANLGVQVITEGNAVRVKISPMDENTRKEMVKICHKRLEEAKVSIRNVRRESNEIIKKQKADGHVEEDMMKKLEKTVQELTDKYCKEVDDIGHKKESEILTI